MRNLLFITEAHTTAIRLIPVFLEADRHSDTRPVMFTTNPPDDSLKSGFREYGVKFLTSEDLLTPDDQKDITAIQNDYANVFKKEMAGYKNSDMSYLGVPLLYIYREYFLQWNIAKLYYMYVFDKLVETLHPDILIVGYDSGGPKKYYVNRARELGITTLHIQYSYYPTTQEFDRKWLNSEYYCLWGEAHLEAFIHDSGLRKNAFFTGSPTFDLHKYDREKMRSELDIDPDDRVFLVGFDQMYEVERFIKEMEQYHPKGDEFFIFKLHPDYYNQVGKVEKLLGNLNFRHRLVGTDISPYKLLSASDYLIVFQRDTLWLESYYYGIPNILVNDRPGHEQKMPFPCLTDTAILMDHLSEMNKLDELQARVDTSKMEMTRKSLFHKTDHQASKRVLEVAHQLIARKENLIPMKRLPSGGGTHRESEVVGAY